MSRVERFLDLYKSKKTKTAYRWALSEFFFCIYGYDDKKLDEHADRYFSENRNHELDLENFISKINDRPPKTVRLMISAVRSFLLENDIELSNRFWRRLIRKLRGSRALTLDKVPSNLELRRILNHMPINGKALFLLLTSSGMRIGEALKLKVDDIDLESRPAKVNIRGNYTKTGNSRIAFISDEALETLKDWLNLRQEYLKTATGKSKIHQKKLDDDRVFPFEINTAYMIWHNALRKSGYLKRDPSTRRNTIHPHVLRKFFRTRLGSVIPTDVVEALMGHEGYLTEVYRRYSEEDLAGFYKQGEHVLNINENAEQVAKLKIEVEERNRQLQTLVNGLTSENLELKQRIAKAENKLKELEGLIKKLLK